MSVEEHGDRLILSHMRHTGEGTAVVRIILTATQLEADLGGSAAQSVGSWWALAGLEDSPGSLVALHDAVLTAQRRQSTLRLFATSAPYEELLIAVLGQRITAQEAARQWRGLCVQFGRSDGATGLVAAPAPSDLSEIAYHRLHRLGIERRRAETLASIGRLFARHPDWLAQSRTVRDRLQRVVEETGEFLPGVGRWTAATVLARAFGEPDALAVGDWHLKNVAAFALRGVARGTDREMLEALEPYRGQRHRVMQLLLADGWRAPRLGPRPRSVHVGTI